MNKQTNHLESYQGANKSKLAANLWPDNGTGNGFRVEEDFIEDVVKT